MNNYQDLQSGTMIATRWTQTGPAQSADGVNSETADINSRLGNVLKRVDELNERLHSLEIRLHGEGPEAKTGQTPPPAPAAMIHAIRHTIDLIEIRLSLAAEITGNLERVA